VAFAGPGDCVRCYHCGGGMKIWQPVDVPVAEHALWFPTCELIRDIIKRNDVSVKQENHEACGSPTKDLTTTEIENLTVTIEDNKHSVISEIQTNTRTKSESESTYSQHKNTSDEIMRENEELQQ